MSAIQERADFLHLVAVPSAVRLGELYATETMIRWGLRGTAEHVAAVVGQLVENSVTTAGHLREPVNWSQVAWVSRLVIRLGLDGATVQAEVEDAGDSPPPDRAGVLLNTPAGYLFPDHGGRLLWAVIRCD